MITAVRKDDGGVIKQVRIGGKAVDVGHVIEMIRVTQGRAEYGCGSPVAKVHVRETHTGREYLTTVPDGTLRNNLDSLPTF